MEHPGEASTPFQGCILFGTVSGTIGKSSFACDSLALLRLPEIWEETNPFATKTNLFSSEQTSCRICFPIVDLEIFSTEFSLVFS